MRGTRHQENFGGPGNLFRLIREKIVFFVLTYFKLIDQPVQISARHTQAARALHFIPPVLVERPKNEPALELADFHFIRAIDAHRFIGTAEHFRFMRILADIQGKMANIHGLSFRQHGGALHGIFEFPDIPRPRILLERKQRLMRKPFHFLVESLGGGDEEQLREQNDIVPTLAQRGDMHVNDIQPVKKILAEFALLYQLLKVSDS